MVRKKLPHGLWACALLAACLTAMITSCHTVKHAASTTKADSSAIAVKTASKQLAEQTSLDAYTTISLDSFELLLMPGSCQLPLDTCKLAASTTLHAINGQAKAWQPMALRAKHATLTKGVLSSKELSLITTQHDSVKVASSCQQTRQSSKDATAIAKPANLGWLIPVCLTIVLAAIIIYRKR